MKSERKSPVAEVWILLIFQQTSFVASSLIIQWCELQKHEASSGPRVTILMQSGKNKIIEEKWLRDQ